VRGDNETGRRDPSRRRPQDCPGAGGRPPADIRALELMLDYAIVEGAELKLPLFVLLLRAARFELASGLAAHDAPGDPRVEQKLMECFKESHRRMSRQKTSSWADDTGPRSAPPRRLDG
jgi:hypothetical protein